MWSSLLWKSSSLVVKECKHTWQWKSPWFLRLFFFSALEGAFRFRWVFWCSLSWSSSTNWTWHIVQVGTGQNPMCLVNDAISRKIRWHLGHLNRMAWQMAWCWRRLSVLLNDFPHSLHSCFTSCWWCLVSICLFKLNLLLNIWSHKWHTCW